MSKDAPAEKPGDAGQAFEREGMGAALWIALMLLMAGMVLMLGSGGWAQTSDTRSKAEFHSGSVTGVQGSVVKIDGRDYTLRPDVVVKNERGDEMQVADIVVGAEVKFHLRRGQIDQLVLVLPR